MLAVDYGDEMTYDIGLWLETGRRVVVVEGEKSGNSDASREPDDDGAPSEKEVIQKQV